MYYLFVSLGEGESLVLGHVGAEHGHGLVLPQARGALRLLLFLQSGGGGSRGAGGGPAVVLVLAPPLEEGAGEIERQGSDGEQRPLLRAADSKEVELGPVEGGRAGECEWGGEG